MRLRQLMTYADDILITARTKQSLKDTFQQLKNNSLEVRLTINEKKTKYLKCAKKDIKTENINIKSSYIEQVKQYKYLGSIINDTSSVWIIKTNYHVDVNFFPGNHVPIIRS